MFKDDNDMIIDECISFFLAGSQTTAATSGNLIYYLMQEPKYLDRVK